MKQIDIYTLKTIRSLKDSKKHKIYMVLPISKCWIGLPKIQYVIWWGKKILDHCDSYDAAKKRRREIWDLA